MYNVCYSADSIFFARWPEVRAVFSCDDIVDNAPRVKDVLRLNFFKHFVSFLPHLKS